VQVKGHANIFAVGDCISVDDTHTSYLGMQPAKMATKNMVILANGQTKLQAWKKNGGMKVNMLCLGKKNTCVALGQYALWPGPSFLTWFKNGATWKKLGMKKSKE
jgi:NADH dehydrogenase FAD-containing subunit